MTLVQLGLLGNVLGQTYNYKRRARLRSKRAWLCKKTDGYAIGRFDELLVELRLLGNVLGQTYNYKRRALLR